VSVVAFLEVSCVIIGKEREKRVHGCNCIVMRQTIQYKCTKLKGLLMFRETMKVTKDKQNG